jgi:cyanophycinase
MERRTEPLPEGAATVHLIGGGRDEDALLPLLHRFVTDAAAARTGGGDGPLIHTLLVLEEDGDESVERFGGALRRAGADVVMHAILEGDVFDAGAIDGADGIFVGGGLTPAYHEALAPVASLVRDRVARGTPYLGFSAGAAIAAERAVIGGYRVDGVAVCDEDAGEELDEVAVLIGLGLVPFSVDVHAAQWGTLSRLVAAGAGLVESGYAIDEHTAVGWRGGESAASVAVAGAGAAWHITRIGDVPHGSVVVNRRIAPSVPARAH